MKRKSNNNFTNFLFFTTSIVIITLFFISLLTVKNECLKTQHEIEQLYKLHASNSDIVKELQSTKEYLMSEENISLILSDKMVSVAPETLSIFIEP